MKYNRLGNSELVVSEICLGTMTFGQQNTAQEAEEQLDRALEVGINFVDAAEMYPVPAQAETQGRTETILGDWLARRNRDQVVVATKIAGQGRPITWLRNGSLAVNRQNVRKAVEASLKRLRTDYIDLYQIHWPDRYVPMFGKTAYEPEQERTATPIAEQLAAFADIARDGKIRYVGLSNETAWGVSEFSRIATQEGLPKVVSIQNAYSLLNRTFDSALAEATRRTNVSLLAYSPLAFGILSGKHHAGPAPGSRLALFDSFGQRYGGVNVAAATAAYVALAQELGLSPAKLSLAFVRSRWFVASTIIGATTRSQLEENLSSLEVTLDSAALARIESIHTRYPSPAP
ncbi:MAG: putative oxidoreductase [Polyangiaceae bacterium]|jgi:aryl-alcohol dehydrogenase-like predicted oxidoreductase|nr:putative oxidoreductase [Polyangiaceae bacterium]